MSLFDHLRAAALKPDDGGDALATGAGDQWPPANAGPAAALARYMDDSRSIPTATTFRTIPVGTLDARRRQINETLAAVGRNMELTVLGRQLVGPVRDLILHVHATVGMRVSFDPARETRCMKIMVSDYATEVFLNKVVARVLRDAPNMTLDLVPLAPRNEVDLGAAWRLSRVIKQVRRLGAFVAVDDAGHAIVSRKALSSTASTSISISAPTCSSRRRPAARPVPPSASPR